MEPSELNKIFKINNNLTNFIVLLTNVSKRPLTFLIDSGADISVINIKSFEFNLDISKEKFCTISGITENSTSSLGTMNLDLYIEDDCINQEFQVVDENFSLITDGILGRNFLINNLCNIDFETFTISINTKEQTHVLDLKTKIPEITSFKIPARSHITQCINIARNEDVLIESQEIADGVFVGNSIVPKKGIAHIDILNTNNTDVQIKQFSIKTEPLNNYDIVDFDQHLHDSPRDDRFQKLLSELNLNISDPKAEESIKGICKDFCDIFHLKTDKLTFNNFYKQKITLSDRKPVYIKNYRLPQSQIHEINQHVEKLIEQDLIEPSVSPYNSPLLLVPKKSSNGEKKTRLVIDFRQLNKKVVDDKFPLTRLDEILDNLGHARFFSTMDLQSSFHQIKLDESSKKLTAFSTQKGHYHFKRLPFGLKISANSFQRMLSIALAGLDLRAFLYVDDIIVFGRNLEDHNKNLIEVFKRFA